MDAGASAKAIDSSLNQVGSSLDRIKAIFVTHEHSDHIRGLKTISKKYGITIYIPGLCAAALPEECGAYVKRNDPGDKVELNEIKVETHRTPHDSAMSVCFRFYLGTKKLGYATDIGYLSHEVQDTIFGCDSVFVESNHDISMLKSGAYPYNIKERILGKFGHLSNDECARFLPYLVKGGTKNIMLAHLSPENNLPELAFETGKNKLNESGIKVAENSYDADVSLSVASPDKIKRLFI